MAGAVEADQLADAVAEMVPVGLGQIVQRVVVEVHAAGGDLVQQRLPQMGARLVDQRDLGLAALAQLVAEAGHQLEPAGAAADDDDPRQGGRGAARGRGVGGGRVGAGHERFLAPGSRRPFCTAQVGP